MNASGTRPSCLLPLVLLVACDELGPAAPPPPPEVVVTEVVAEDVPYYMEFVGQTAGVLDIQIRARVDGVIDEVAFEEGKPVTKEQLLYRIDPAPFQAKLREAQGQLAEANARFVRAKSDLGRIEPLVKIDALSKRTLDDAQAEHDAAKGLVDAAEALVENAKIDLSYTELRSPIDGLIGISEAYEGDYVGRYPNPVVLATVSDLDPVRVRFSVSERDYLKFVQEKLSRAKAEGKSIDELVEDDPSPLELYFSDGSKHPDIGKVDFADREIDSTTGTLMLEATFPNEQGVVRPGQFARVRALIRMMEGAAIVPQRAVQEIQGTYQVIVVDAENKASTRRIVPGIRLEDRWVIDEGLKVGERVVVEGLHRVRTGMVVSPIKPEAKDSEQSGEAGR
ncbi:MAG: efflux RND transporter periplasmic adaptor subunit [Planctomycetota bacterium]|jgi:membrane fusion protein (multidrug efflux system)